MADLREHGRVVVGVGDVDGDEDGGGQRVGLAVVAGLHFEDVGRDQFAIQRRRHSHLQ